MPLSFQSAKYLKSIATTDQLPIQKGTGGLPEVAFVGRSNVGKSSLINHLTNFKGLAKTSTRPGKTQMLNLFDIDKELLLIDLPGYGYAKVPKHLLNTWRDLIESYLLGSSHLKLIVQLIDARHTLSDTDKSFFEWASHHNLPLLVVFTKCDKLKQKEMNKVLKHNLSILGEETPYVAYSIKKGYCRKTLIEKVQGAIK